MNFIMLEFPIEYLNYNRPYSLGTLLQFSTIIIIRALISYNNKE